MKIKYTLYSNFNFYNENYFFNLYYKRIFKRGTFFFANFLLNLSFCLLAFIIGFVLSFNIYNEPNSISILPELFMIVCIYYIVSYIILITNFFINYLKNGNRKLDEAVSFDKDGITENNNGKCLNYSWDNLLGMIVGKHSINIYTNSYIVFRYPISIRKEIYEAINKYNTNNNFKIIDFTNENE